MDLALGWDPRLLILLVPGGCHPLPHIVTELGAHGVQKRYYQLQSPRRETLFLHQKPSTSGHRALLLPCHPSKLYFSLRPFPLEPAEGREGVQKSGQPNSEFIYLQGRLKGLLFPEVRTVM